MIDPIVVVGFLFGSELFKIDEDSTSPKIQKQRMEEKKVYFFSYFPL